MSATVKTLKTKTLDDNSVTIVSFIVPKHEKKLWDDVCQELEDQGLTLSDYMFTMMTFYQKEQAKKQMKH